MAGEWTTADYALIVSLCSAGIALFSLGWNVWSKFIYPKPKVTAKAFFAFVDPELEDATILGNSADILTIDTARRERAYGFALCLHATNFGPGSVSIDKALAVCTKGKNKGATGVLFPCEDYPRSLRTPKAFGGGLGRVLSPGESLSIYFPAGSEWIGSKFYNKLVLEDSFGRRHRIRAKDLKTVKKVISQFGLDPS